MMTLSTRRNPITSERNPQFLKPSIHRGRDREPRGRFPSFILPHPWKTTTPRTHTQKKTRRALMSMAAAATGTPKKFTVAGAKQSVDFQKTANVVAALEHLYPSRVKAEIVEFEDEAKCKA